jgi:hypothetical protein
MKKRVFIALVSLFALASFWWAGAANQNPATNAPKPDKPTNVNKIPLNFEAELNENPGVYTLDHFLVYTVTPEQVNINVQLKGQFDQDYKWANLRYRDRFLNPVDKNQEGILNPFAHLNWYRIDAPQEPQRTLSVNNQFGQQVLVIGNAVALLAPTEKIEDGSQFPQGLDHYKIYRVLQGQSVMWQVDLTDQFGNHTNIAGQPVFFGVPVEKIHNGELFPINNPKDHIVFYQINPYPVNEFRPTVDQFGGNPMQTNDAVLLGVPTDKLAWQQQSTNQGGLPPSLSGGRPFFPRYGSPGFKRPWRFNSMARKGARFFRYRNEISLFQ